MDKTELKTELKKVLQLKKDVIQNYDEEDYSYGIAMLFKNFEITNDPYGVVSDETELYYCLGDPCELYEHFRKQGISQHEIKNGEIDDDSIYISMDGIIE